MRKLVFWTALVPALFVAWVAQTVVSILLAPFDAFCRVSESVAKVRKP